MNPDVWETDSTSLSVIWVQKIKRSEIAHLIKKIKTPMYMKRYWSLKKQRGLAVLYCSKEWKRDGDCRKKTKEFFIKYCAQEHEYNYNFNVNDALYTNQT